MAGDVRGISGKKILTGGTFTKMEAKIYLMANVRFGVKIDRHVLRLNIQQTLFTALIGTQVQVLKKS